MSKKKEGDLRKAALDGDVPLLNSLIASGVNLEAPQPKDGQTALMYASANGYTDAMEVLIKAGANLEGRDKFGFTAMMVAATTGEAGAIEFLLTAGAKIDAKDNFGNTALKKAREQKHPEAVQVLEDAMQQLGGGSARAVAPALAAPARAVAPAQVAPTQAKRAAPDEGDEGPNKKGKAKADGTSTDQLAGVTQSIAMHLARAREHAQLAKAVLVSFAEAGGDPRMAASMLSPEDKSLLAATIG